MFRDDKKIEIFSVRGQNRILKDSLKKVLGSGLLQSPQRSHHIIHPHDLKTLFDFQKLNREYEK